MDVNCLFQTVLNKTINIELKLKISNCADKFFNWAHNLQTFVYIILLWPRRLYLHNEFNPYHIHKIQILHVDYSSTLEDLRTIHSSHTSHTTYHLFLLKVNTKYLFQLRFGLRFEFTDSILELTELHTVSQTATETATSWRKEM